MERCEEKLIAHLVEFIRDKYRSSDEIPLHEPTFAGNEKRFLTNTIDSTFVSTRGEYVDAFEKNIKSYTGSSEAVATVNGTAALHSALYLAGVQPGDLVITQALTFVATGNAILQLGAHPVFVDVDKGTLGLCPDALEVYLIHNAVLDTNGHCIHKVSGARIRGVVPMHTFGHPVEIDRISRVCLGWNLFLVEDAAESLGSFFKGIHTGTFGDFGAISFNGNKILTTGGGGILLCKCAASGIRARHINSTAKVAHQYEFIHDEFGFNYRMPNVNAALGCAQFEQLNVFLAQKRKLAEDYEVFFDGSNYRFVKEPKHARSNYWLNAVICETRDARDQLLTQTNVAGIKTRPAWTPLHKLPAFAGCARDALKNTDWLFDRLVNLPSTPIRAG